MSTAHSTRISLRLRELNQLFNSMDPSPFIDRDLDHDAEEFIVSSAREAHGSRSFELMVHLATPPESGRSAETEAAVQHYFSVRAEMKRREFRLLLRRGHSYLAIGFIFLTACLLLSGTVAKLSPAPLAQVLQEGLIIVGWVAMWKPLETYLYDWWPVRREWTDLKRLARMRVRLVTAHAKTSTPAKDVTATAVAHIEHAPSAPGLPASV
jgi:hypothetical protein